MRRPCLKPQVYSFLYPSPSSEDPQDWVGFVTGCLVPEVRSETVRFYGPSSEEEARWPGLDYSSRAHRLRLSAFPHHRALFQAFDCLGLTVSEIYDICKWEGTKYAKDRYNATHSDKVRDTTWDGIRDDNRQRRLPAARRHVPGESCHSSQSPAHKSRYLVAERSAAHLECDEDDRVVERSVGVSLNERLRAATAARLQGHDVPLDPAYEAWLKEATERGTIAPGIVERGVISQRPRILHHGGRSLSPLRAGEVYGFMPGAANEQHSLPELYNFATVPGATTGVSRSPFSSRSSHAPSHSSHPSSSARHSSHSASSVTGSSAPGSRYWTQTVPEIFRYGSQTVYQTPALAHIIETQAGTPAPPELPRSAYPPLTASSVVAASPRYQFVPTQVPGHMPGRSSASSLRRAGRSGESRR